MRGRRAKRRGWSHSHGEVVPRRGSDSGRVVSAVSAVGVVLAAGMASPVLAEVFDEVIGGFAGELGSWFDPPAADGWGDFGSLPSGAAGLSDPIPGLDAAVADVVNTVVYTPIHQVGELMAGSHLLDPINAVLESATGRGLIDNGADAAFHADGVITAAGNEGWLFG